MKANEEKINNYHHRNDELENKSFFHCTTEQCTYTPAPIAKPREISFIDPAPPEPTPFIGYREELKKTELNLTINPEQTQVGGSHYKDFAIQPSEFIHKNKLGWAEGNVIKYVCRHGFKNGAEDLRKAIHYLELLLKWAYGEER